MLIKKSKKMLLNIFILFSGRSWGCEVHLEHWNRREHCVCARCSSMHELDYMELLGRTASWCQEPKKENSIQDICYKMLFDIETINK